jgi:hypothetical protein
MAETVTRPTFYEGQILAPGDLNGSLEYARDGLARHERYLHTWGIATGLELVPEARALPGGSPFVAVTVSSGMAIDASGRQIVVATDQPLSEGLFELINGGRTKPGDWYPVFLVGHDEQLPPATALGGACDVSPPPRITESFEITFGRLGEQQELLDQRAPEVGDGPGGGAVDGQRSKVLLGFVQWDEENTKFSDAKARPEGTGPTYAGVAADSVVARGGELVLRSRAPAEAGKPAATITEAGGGELHFGLQDASGKVKPVFRVTASGDVIADGKVAGAVTAGLHIESGIATDGILLPLPTGITPAQVEAGQAVLHVHVTPRYDDLAGATPTPIVCVADGRRVHCRFEEGGKGVPGRCDYTLLAYVSSEGGSGS